MTGDRLRDATRKVAAKARRHLGPHPSPRELIAYQAGELSAADEDQLQAHLALCPQCTATVLDLASFPEVELRPGATGPEEDIVPDWQSVRAILKDRGVEQAGARAESAPAGREKLLLALAAGFFLATLGLSYRLFQSDRPERELARGDLPVFTLMADRVTRGEELLPVSAEPFNLMLFLVNPGSYPSYSLEAVATSSGRVVWRLEGLVPTAEGMFLVVGLSRRELPPGSYRLRLSGSRDARSRLLTEYPISVMYK